MNKIFIVIIVCFIIIQAEIVGLFMLDSMNLKLWNSQVNLNESIVKVCIQ